MPRSFLELHESRLFHGDDTGSTPVRDAKFLGILEIFANVEPTPRFLMDVFMDVSERGAAVTQKNNRIKINFIQPRCPLAATINSGWQKRYRNPRLPRLVLLRLPCARSQQAHTIACYRSPCGDNMTTQIHSRS
ncbi:MAG: hypothetical protein DMF74_20800 [Acidobacteria bacterium]|nr:MAG: hypothetical protein DMF74_20800 [Acidobacteriota bacterium]